MGKKGEKGDNGGSTCVLFLSFFLHMCLCICKSVRSSGIEAMLSRAKLLHTAGDKFARFKMAKPATQFKTVVATIRPTDKNIEMLFSRRTSAWLCAIDDDSCTGALLHGWIVVAVAASSLSSIPTVD